MNRRHDAVVVLGAAPGFWRDGPWWDRLAVSAREMFAFVAYLWILRRRAGPRRGGI